MRQQLLFICLFCVAFVSQAENYPYLTDGVIDTTNYETAGLIPTAGIKTVTIFTADEHTDHYANGVVMTAFKGKLYCMWQSSPKDEDSDDTWVAYSISSDEGITWSKPRPLALPSNDYYCTSGGWLVRGDTLTAFIDTWQKGLEPRGGKTYYMTSTDGVTWSRMQPVRMADGSVMEGVMEQDPYTLPDGRIVGAVHFMPGLHVCPVYTDDPRGISVWRKGGFESEDCGKSSREIEPSQYLQSDGSIVMLFRDQNSSFRKLASVSTDRGETWTKPALTNFPDGRTKQCAGNLPNGTAFMVSCPANGKRRWPLVLQLSNDGRAFDKAILLRSGASNDLPPRRFEGRYKTLGYSYPKATVWHNKLYISYSTNKEDVECTIVPLDSCWQTEKVQQSLLPPKADDAFWRDAIPVKMRQSYVRYGEQYLGKSWTVLPWTVFAENKINGNRVNYEKLCFEKRRQLAALVMAEIMEGKGRFISDIIDGIGSFCEETWWGIPAHYSKAIPQAELQEVDLFNAETASLIAWTRYMLEKQFNRFSPDLCNRIDHEMERRLFDPAVRGNYWWKTAGMNWNPWICSNWLTCVLICEKNEVRKTEAIAQIRKATQAFIDAYPEDGGCDEGPGYWDRAAASMFEVMRLLPDFSDNDTKIKNMAAYAYKTYIGNDYCVNFADAHENKAVQQVNIVYPFGLWLGDKTMREFGAYLGRQKDILDNPAALYDKSGNFPTLGRELMFLHHIRDFMAEQPHEPSLKDVWLPNLQMMTARRGNLFVAMKGGHNGESHNHNDVGSFIVYANNEPLFIDPGVGEYTAKTFGKDRYDIWTMQSQYHNLPQINGVDQKDGRQYAAKVFSHKDGQLCLDIAGAYPAEAKVKTWKRTVSSAKSGITITEEYQLADYSRPTRLMFITPDPDALSHIHYDAHQLSASVEDISHQLDPLLQGIWGSKMYRIILTVKSTKTSNKIRYSIQ